MACSPNWKNSMNKHEVKSETTKICILLARRFHGDKLVWIVLCSIVQGFMLNFSLSRFWPSAYLCPCLSLLILCLACTSLVAFFLVSWLLLLSASTVTVAFDSQTTWLPCWSAPLISCSGHWELQVRVPWPAGFCTTQALHAFSELTSHDSSPLYSLWLSHTEFSVIGNVLRSSWR